MLLAGCGAADERAADAATTGTASTVSSPAPTPAGTPTQDPLDQCTHQLAYWADEMLADFDNPGWDYQHMGLTSAKYDELRALVAAAQQASATGPLPTGWVEQQVLLACERLLASSPPSTSAVGWP